MAFHSWKEERIMKRALLVILGAALLMAPCYYTFIGLALFGVGYLLERTSPHIPVLGRRPEQLVR
jgi:hypothetical protein